MTSQKRLLANEYEPLVRQFEQNLSGAGGHAWRDAGKLFLRKENPWPAAQGPIPWSVRNGTAKIALTSDGTTGRQWVGRLRKQGVAMSASVAAVLRSKEFAPTKGRTVEVRIGPTGPLFNAPHLRVREIFQGAQGRPALHPEIACLLLDRISSAQANDMQLQTLAVVHVPILVVQGNMRSGFFEITFGEDGSRELSIRDAWAGEHEPRGRGFIDTSYTRLARGCDQDAAGR